MRSALITFIFSFITLFATAQDSLVYYQELSFSSELEEKAFSDFFLHGQQNYLELFMATSPLSTTGNYNVANQKIETEINSIDKEKLFKKKPEKRVKALYDQIHADFLSKYELQNNFTEIFTNGNYNCVSASALYSLFFESFEIPYAIKESPTHVYVIAYPKSARILVESTDPGGKFIVFDDRYKSDFVNRMKSAKLISEAEYNSKTVSQLFDQYYFSEEEIGLKELVGIQYSNEALYKLEKENYLGAYEDLKKSYLLYPSKKVSSMLMMVNSILLSRADYYDSTAVQQLNQLSRFKEYGFTNDDMLAEFGRLTNDILINHTDFDRYAQAYVTLTPSFKDEELRKEVDFVFNYENGRILYNRHKYSEALSYLEKAYNLKSDNANIEELLVANIIQQTRSQSNNIATIAFLEKRKETHPALTDNISFKSLLTVSYLVESGNSFDLNRIQDGLKYMHMFEEQYSKDLSIDTEYIGRFYAIAATYYFKKGNTSKAKQTIEKGLEYAPGHHELLIRKRMIR
ncbi:hypothetical protein [Fulvivirga ligni]|uniref:hypothetical protein n=1 Tax=Fulvivirga ligni TaxID=2904246 RepID=UPI001F1CBEBA|nr:hypothetical protein [Fulvivirga ligni]UII21999.1 hypothetical protein LVD16_01985 [Fulvivirga ligni]